MTCLTEDLPTVRLGSNPVIAFMPESGPEPQPAYEYRT